jgi:hypothetical protein
MTSVRVLRTLAICFVGACAARFGAVLWDLERAERRSAWDEIRDRGLRDLVFVVDDPYAVGLWLKAGRDPNGEDCASYSDRPPNPLAVAFGKPLGLCAPENADGMPFMRLAVRSYTPLRLAVARLMVAAGVDVNMASPEGILPLRAAVAARNGALVELLLDAGANPDLRSGNGSSEEFDSARQFVERYPSDPDARAFARLMAEAARRRQQGQLVPR